MSIRENVVIERSPIVPSLYFMSNEDKERHINELCIRSKVDSLIKSKVSKYDDQEDGIVIMEASKEGTYVDSCNNNVRDLCGLDYNKKKLRKIFTSPQVSAYLKISYEWRPYKNPKSLFSSFEDGKLNGIKIYKTSYKVVPNGAILLYYGDDTWRYVHIVGLR